jgi:hypothetical protein
MGWDKHTKPPSDFCPGKYCFMWVPPGGKADMSGRSYKSLEKAFANQKDWVSFPKGGCSCSRGICTRIDPVNGDGDFYESCGPALKEDGLPWFYFISSVANLAKPFHEEYVRESQKLWGENKEKS